jgi:hypothetical protein
VTTAGADVQITDLTVDDHACLTFGEPEELFDLTAAFVRDGLAGGLKVVWVTEAGTGFRDAGSWPVEQGHGLWLVRKVADQASLDTGPSGTVAVVDFRFEPVRATS